MTVVILSQDISSERVHKRARIGAGWATLEGCNADDAEEWRIITEEELASLPESALCLRCFAEEPVT